MGITIRYYLFPEGAEPQRLSQRLVDGVIAGTDSMPQFANTRQKVLGVVLENQDGEPERIFRHEATVWEFDAAGDIRTGLQQAMTSGSAMIAPTSSPRACRAWSARSRAAA